MPNRHAVYNTPTATHAPIRTRTHPSTHTHTHTQQGYCASNPRKMVKVWAEKEMRNYMRLQAAGIPAPRPILLRQHVLVMEFLGKDGWCVFSLSFPLPLSSDLAVPVASGAKVPLCGSAS